jgi:large subunit ribosomal protein L10
VLLAKVAGVLKALPTRAAGLFQAPLSQVARLAKALEEKTPGEAAPAAEAAAPEAVTEAAAAEAVTEAPAAEAVTEAPAAEAVTEAPAETTAEVPESAAEPETPAEPAE